MLLQALQSRADHEATLLAAAASTSPPRRREVGKKLRLSEY